MTREHVKEYTPLRGDGISQGRMRRTAPLLGLSARTAAGAAVAGLHHRLTGADTSEFHARTAQRYADLFGHSKGALMKAAQALSLVTLGPAVPAQFKSIYQTALGRLRADAPPMAPELARAVLERELGRRVEEAFAHFDWRPIAAASIGQVHAAQLHDGLPVAVKVQYPGVAEAIDADLRNTELLATFLALIFGISPRKVRFDIRGAGAEMRARITEELDYRAEAANQAEFARHYRGHPFIHVPEVIVELCTDRVLTQELVCGRSWEEAIGAGQQLRDSWAEVIVRFITRSHLCFCALYADPHPGNYLFHDDGSVSFLDFGCIKRFRRERVDMMRAISRACLHGDVLGTWRAAVEAGVWSSSDPVTPDEAFAYWHEPWRLWWDEQPFTITPEYVAEWIERKFSPTGPSANAFSYITASPEYTFTARFEMAAASVGAELRPRNHWRSIALEYLEGAPALTEMGKLEQAFFGERNRRAANA